MPNPVVIYADEPPNPDRPPLLHIQVQARQATVNGKSGWCPSDGDGLHYDKPARLLSCPTCDAHWRVPVAVFLPLEGFYPIREEALRAMAAEGGE